tara:strand:+ start:616 stop:792 length:177 start_codon:yes stop_codon:yes gene_type:complete
MKNRLVRNWTTTILGLSLISYCAFMMYRGSSASEMAGFFGMGGLLLRSKDSLIGLPKQ